MPNPTIEQQKVLESNKNKLIVSASAGSGKTFVLIEYITKLICERKVPVRRLLVLTFTKAAASEMKERLNKSILSQKQTPFLIEQIDDLSISDISTIDAFCERVIKRHLDKTDLDEAFKVLDEQASSLLKQKAFEKTIEAMAESQEYSQIYYAFRKNKDAIFDAIKYFYDFFSSQKDSERLINQIISDQSCFYNKAVEYLNDYFAKEKKKLFDQIESLTIQAEGKYKEFCVVIKSMLDNSDEKLSKSCDQNIHEKDESAAAKFAKTSSSIAELELPSLPRVTAGKDEELVAKLKVFKKKLEKFKDFATKFYILDDKLQAEAKSGSLAVSLMRFYLQFEKFYKDQKGNVDGLDFADLEKICLKLLEDDEVLLSLQEKYDYIFIDEYQDTNPIQEAIVKPIAGKGRFVAVGDLKQGIYGFRNASMEIMSNDIFAFSSGEDDSDALFLRGNFRSEKGILEFVNCIFEKIMTDEGVGVDYKSTSMLEALAPYQTQNFSSVKVEFVKNESEESAEKAKIYSVAQDKLYTTNKNKLEVEAIIAHIDELLSKEMFDLKLKSYRKIMPSDICVLFRGRTSLMQELSLALQKKGLPVICESKYDLLQEPEIAVLVALVSLTINFNDDISLASVMLSYLGGFSLEEVALMQSENNGGFLYDYINSSSDEKVLNFKQTIQKFSKNCQLLGVCKALQTLFAQVDYYAYLAYQEDGDERTSKVMAFLNDISSSGFDFDRAALLHYFSGGQQKSDVGQAGAARAVTLTTIHASKGLEYPVVVLAGSGDKLEKPSRKNYALSKNFGLGTNAFNSQNNLKCTTPVFEAIKLEKRRREFIDEIMIFYVALTRAKNHLYIVGKIDDYEMQENGDLFEKNSYLELICYALGQNFIQNLVANKKVELSNWQFEIVENVESVMVERDTSLLYKPDEDMQKELEKFFDFKYKNQEVCKLSYKNSVTSVLKLDEVEEFGYSSTSRNQAIEEGNAHHEALRKIDFDKVFDESTLKAQLECANLSENYLNLIDKKILLENILTIKKVTSGKLIKEKEFVMTATLSDISEINSDEEVLVQGAVDCFCLGDKPVLIDYKFTSQKNTKKIKEKYNKQLNLYAKAIEKAFKIKLYKKYILSLKYNELIEIN